MHTSYRSSGERSLVLSRHHHARTCQVWASEDRRAPHGWARAGSGGAGATPWQRCWVSCCSLSRAAPEAGGDRNRRCGWAPIRGRALHSSGSRRTVESQTSARSVRAFLRERARPAGAGCEERAALPVHQGGGSESAEATVPLGGGHSLLLLRLPYVGAIAVFVPCATTRDNACGRTTRAARACFVQAAQASFAPNAALGRVAQNRAIRSPRAPPS